jgi:lipopolysaccharide core galacturonosyltransferase RgtB
MTLGHERRDRALERRFLLAMLLYFALHVLLRVTISDSLDYDEAEQALLGQWLLAGYTEQPPLYTWLQYLLFTVFGENVFAISLLKNSLLFATYLFFLLAGREILADSRAAVLAAAALLLIPQIAWESQRDMTHTTLAVAAAAATLYQGLRLVRQPTATAYLLFGLCVGIGILAKANYLLFFAVLLLSLLTTREGRRVCVNPAILLSAATALMVAGGYLHWMYGNLDIVFSASHKFKRVVEPDYAAGILSLTTKSLLFLTPFWLLFLLLFPEALRGRGRVETEFPRRLIGRYLLTLALLLLAMVLLLKVTYVKDRWLQPLLFVAPLYAFSRLAPERLSPRRSRLFLSLALLAALGVYTAFTMRVVSAQASGHFPRLNYPFTAMASDIRTGGFQGGVIVSNDRFLAGNLRWRFPGSTALIPGYRLENLVDAGQSLQAIAVWDGKRHPQIPAELADYLRATYRIEAAAQPISFYDHRYAHAKSESVSLAVLTFTLPPR